MMRSLNFRYMVSLAGLFIIVQVQAQADYPWLRTGFSLTSSAFR